MTKEQITVLAEIERIRGECCQLVDSKLDALTIRVLGEGGSELKEKEHMFQMENPAFYWLNKKTFTLAFDGGVDEDGDDYSYQVRYYEDTGDFIFERWYESYTIPAGFLPEQENYIKSIMLKEMAEDLEHRQAAVKGTPFPLEQCQQQEQMLGGMKQTM